MGPKYFFLILLAGCAVQVEPPAEAGDPPCWAVGETRRILDTYQSSVGELTTDEIVCASSFQYLEADGDLFLEVCGDEPARGCNQRIGAESVIVIHARAWDPELILRHEVMHSILACRDGDIDAQHLDEAWAWVAEDRQTNDSPGCVLVQGP